MDACTDVQLTKFFTANSREPFVVETKTTTTTTTVTKRICVSKDANVDLADIQSLLENDNANPKIATSTVAPIASDKSIETTLNGKKGAKNDSHSRKHKENPNQSLLSSTKIDHSNESKEKENFLVENQRTSFLSPNLSKINNRFEVTSKNVENKTKRRTASKKKKSVKKMEPDAATERNQRSTRSKTVARTTDSNYINNLISEYMTLDRKPPRRKVPPKKVVEKTAAKPAPLPPPVEPKDLSAIFENSDESEPSPPHEPFSVSPIQFDDGPSNDCDCSAPMEDQFLGHGQSSGAETSGDELLTGTETAKENDKNKQNKQNKRKLSKSTDASKESTAKTGKKPRKTSKTAPRTMATKQQKPLQTHEQSPITIYSPSHRGQLKSGADNKLVLTKQMIAKKLKNIPGSSQSVLGRLGSSNEMAIDEHSRLIYYPNERNEQQSDDEMDGDDVDFLSILASRKKPLLVKETIERYDFANCM